MRLMREHPLALLVSNGPDGLPVVTHLPLHAHDRRGQLILSGHMAGANPHGQLLARQPQALVVFTGPNAYLSPQVYGDDPSRVPSWNYLAVHCTVQARMVEDPKLKDILLKRLILDHEKPYAKKWHGLDAGFRLRMLGAIAAFELDVLHWQCTLKLNQHHPGSHAAMHAAYASGAPGEQALAGWMQTLGLAPAPGQLEPGARGHAPQGGPD